DNGPTWIGAPAIWGVEATTRDLSASLVQTIPPGSTYSGSGTFTYDLATNELTWTVSYNVPQGTFYRRDLHIRHGADTILSRLNIGASPASGSGILTDEQE